MLSVGCGNGIDVQTLRTFGYQSYGVDPLPCGAPFVIQASGAELPFPDSSFDAVVSLEVIEHVPHDLGESRAQYCRELMRVSRRAILIATPNRLFPIDEHGDPIRWHSPFRDSTLSYKELCSCFPGWQPQTMPWGKYFALERFRKYVTPAGTALANAAFQLLTPEILHRSPLNPHLFVGFTALRRRASL